ncbi:MAG: efflux RND transporter periplasmic adaptor subunit [Defluviitaleaceae bacterium]|nr:efflux RND transporter periplasmic adaptor subunit [Defluviitaleaceae bacterium]
MKKKFVFIGLAAAAAVGAFVVFGTNIVNVGTHDAMMAMGGGTVITTDVGRSDLRQVVSANGRVELERVEPIYSSAEGETRLRVAEVHVQVGDEVEEGQTIVTYDIEEAMLSITREISNSQIRLENQRLSIQAQNLGPTDTEHRGLRNQVYSAQDGILRAEESIIDAQERIADRHNDIYNQRQNLENARREYEQARIELEVSSRILALGGITRHEFDAMTQNTDNLRIRAANAETDLQNSILNLETAERALEAAERGLETAERGLEDAEAHYEQQMSPLTTESARISHQQMLNDLALSESNHRALLEQRDRLISETVSHTSGTVIAVEVSVGAQVTGTSKLVEIADFSRLMVEAEIREVDAPQVFVGQSVSMTSAGIAGTVYNGTVTRVSPTATTRQAQTGVEVVVPIEVSVDNPDEHLRPGFSVDIEIIMVESPDTVNIPVMAIMMDFETGAEYVMLIDEQNILRRRDITRGISTALDVEVLEGLEAGDRIVLTPTPMMQDGDPLPDDIFDGGGAMQGNGGGGMAVRRGGGGGGGGVVIRTN